MFLLGVAEGLNQQLDRNLQREIWLGKENKEAQSRLIKARASTLAAIVGGRAKEESELKENVRVIAAFEERLSGLESQTMPKVFLAKLPSLKKILARVSGLRMKSLLRCTI
jgi:hypothetical protein